MVGSRKAGILIIPLIIGLGIALLGGGLYQCSRNPEFNCSERVREPDTLFAVSPEVAAQSDFSSGDRRFFYCRSYTNYMPIPGLPEGVEFGQLVTYCRSVSQFTYGSKLMPGTSDVVESDEHAKKLAKSRSYVKAYNAKMLSLIVEEIGEIPEWIKEEPDPLRTILELKNGQTVGAVNKVLGSPISEKERVAAMPQVEKKLKMWWTSQGGQPKVLEGDKFLIYPLLLDGVEREGIFLQFRDGLLVNFDAIKEQEEGPLPLRPYQNRIVNLKQTDAIGQGHGYNDATSTP